MKRISRLCSSVLSILICLAFCLQMLPIMAATSSTTVTSDDWAMRSETRGFQLIDNGSGITSMDSTGAAVTPDNAAALLTYSLGYEAFEIKFDLTWGATNPMDTDEAYGDTYVYLFLNTTGTVADEGNDAYAADNQIVLKSRNLDVASLNGATSLGSVSLGTDADGNCISLADGVTEGRLALADNVLTYSVYKDDALLKSIAINYNEGTLDSSALKYLGVAVYGNHAFSISNVEVVSSDVDRVKGDWTLRNAPNGFAVTETGITSILDDGISAGSSVAVYNTALGAVQFEVSFDLTWDSSNIQEGQAGYTSTFLTVGLADSTDVPASFDPLGINHSFRVTTNHFQAANGVSGVSTPSTGIVDFGGKTLKNMTAAGVSKVYLKLKNNVLSIYVQDGSTQRGAISYTFVDGYFDLSKPLYLSLSVWGEDVAFSVDNVTIHSSDEVDETVKSDWSLRDIEGGFALTGTDGITSVLADGTAVAGSAAIYKKALGGKNFTASFDLTWGAANPQRGRGRLSG